MEDDDNFKANVEPSKPQSRKAKPRTKTPPVAVKDEDTAQEDKDVEVTDVKEEDISDHQSGNEAAEEAPLPKRRKKANKGGTKVDEAGKRTNLETSKGSVSNFPLIWDSKFNGNFSRPNRQGLPADPHDPRIETFRLDLSKQMTEFPVEVVLMDGICS